MKLDIYFPLQPKRANAPALVFFHGDDEDRGRADPLDDFLTAGYVVADADFRPASSHKIPTPVGDARCAVRFLRANAAAYQIDPNAIGAYGCSFGGFLTGILATASDQKQFDVDPEYSDQSSAVQAAAPISGVFNWKSFLDLPGKAALINHFFGTDSTDVPVVLQSSPITYVNEGDTPFLIVQGEKDTEVPPIQGDEMIKQLKATGVPVDSILVKGGEHCVRNQFKNDPARIEWIKRVVNFFDENLK